MSANPIQGFRFRVDHGTSHIVRPSGRTETSITHVLSMLVRTGQAVEVGRMAWHDGGGLLFETRLDQSISAPYAVGMAANMVDCLCQMSEAILAEADEFRLDQNAIERSMIQPFRRRKEAG